jgi:hypothetical protein
LKEHVQAPAANCVYDMFRTNINAKLRYGEILVDPPLRVGLQGLNGHCATNGTSDDRAPLGAEDQGEIPSLGWADRHLPQAEGTVASTLRTIAASACGLSGRNLRGLLDVALFTYFVDGPPYLSDALSALERVVQKEADQAGSGGRTKDEIGARRKLVGQDEDAGQEEDVELPENNYSACSRLPLPIDINVYSSDC